MKKRVITAVSFLLSFAFCFICIGYAQLVDTLTITGRLEAKPPETIFISAMEVSSLGKDISAESSSFIFPTTVENTVSTSNTNWNANRTVTYAITVQNNTRYRQVYKGIDGTMNNFTVVTKAGVNDRTQTFVPNESTVEPGETLTFYATYTYNSRNLSNVTSELNYQFGIHVSSLGDLAMERVLIRFGEILNTDSTYQDLITHIDDKYKGQDWQANYIGNVWGAHNDDTETVKRLFGEQLSFTMDGVTKNITLLIKRDNFDNNENTGDSYSATYRETSWPYDTYTTTNKGCEMVLYMTANDLDKIIEEGEYSADRNQADVYIAIFTCQADANGNPVGNWYQIGDVYKGYAPIVSYDGSTDGTGSFVTDDWTSLQATYQVTEHYSYTISRGDGRSDNVQDIREILPQTDVLALNEYERLMEVAKKEIDYIKANSDYFNEDVFAEPIAELEAMYEKASAMNFNENTPRAHFIKILKELEYATYPFLSYI